MKSDAFVRELMTMCPDPTMTQTFFNHFRCRRVSAVQWVLDTDYTIECSWSSAVWAALATFSALGLIFVIGFPIGA